MQLASNKKLAILLTRQNKIINYANDESGSHAEWIISDFESEEAYAKESSVGYVGSYR